MFINSQLRQTRALLLPVRKVPGRNGFLNLSARRIGLPDLH